MEKPRNDELRLQKEKLKLKEENERLRDREILRSIYANQRLQMLEKDGLQAKPFAQEILKLIGELKLIKFIEFDRNFALTKLLHFLFQESSRNMKMLKNKIM